MFGWPALARVRGFSPPEMHLPNHPAVLHAYVRTLRRCGYQWLFVQEHSVEELDGQPLRERYLPRKLVARNSRGEEATITAMIKTQGSDTKLVGHMQPVHEARSLGARKLAGKTVPPIAMQISDATRAAPGHVPPLACAKLFPGEVPGSAATVTRSVRAERDLATGVGERLPRLVSLHS